MVVRTSSGRISFESRDGLGVLLSETRAPYWLRKPPTPELLKPTAFRVTQDHATLDLFDGPPPAPAR